MVKNKKYFGFFLVSYISIQKKKCTSEQFLQGRPTGPVDAPFYSETSAIATGKRLIKKLKSNLA